MPDPKPARRSHVSIRLAPKALEQVDALAEAEERNRSDMLRKLLSEALAARARRSR